VPQAGCPIRNGCESAACVGSGVLSWGVDSIVAADGAAIGCGPIAGTTGGVGAGPAATAEIFWGGLGIGAPAFARRC